MPSFVLNRIPFVRGLAGYRPSWLRDDVGAGLAIAAVGIPSAIAYPAIAGLPVATGLLASTVPLVAYALVGPSRRLIVGPDAATMTVLAAVLASMAAAHPVMTAADRSTAAAAIALGVGAICLAASLLRLGGLAGLLSRPILVGFFSGMALSIVIGQIGRCTGVRIDAEGLIAPVVELVRQAGSIHATTVAVAAGMLTLLHLVRRAGSPVPGPVVVVIAATLLSWVADLPGRGVAVVGDLPPILSMAGWPDLSRLPWLEIAEGAAATFTVAFGGGIIGARSFAVRDGATVDPNAELFGFGAANVVAGLAGAFPVTTSDSRTAVNVAAGGRTQVAQVVAALALAAIVTFLSGWLSILPLPALGAILVSAAVELIDLTALRQLWRVSRIEFAFALIAFAGAVSFGVLQGVAFAIMATLAYVLYKGMHPRVAMCGRIEGRDGFYKLHRSPAAKPIPGCAICLVQGSLLFFNVDHVKARLDEIIAALPAGTRWFVIDASAMAMVDTTSAHMLEDLRADLARRDMRMGLAELASEAAALLERAGVFDAMGREMVFEDLDDALNAFLSRPLAPPVPAAPAPAGARRA